MANKSTSRRSVRNGYREKNERLGKHHYDVDSKSFQAGAWKNLNQEEYDRNQRNLRRMTDIAE